MNMKRTVGFLSVITFVIVSDGCAPRRADSLVLQQKAIDTALVRYFSNAKNTDTLIYRTIFTPGRSRRVGDRDIRVITRSDIQKGKDVSLVRIGEVRMGTTDSVPEDPTIVVTLVSWSEIGQEPMIPMHGFLTYKMKLDKNGMLTVVEETLTME
jgi:putative sterol carrier protein